MKKLYFAFLLLLLAALPAIAQTQFWYEGVHFEVSGDQTVRVIEAYDNSYAGVVTIPQVAKFRTISTESGMYGVPIVRTFLVTEIASDAFRSSNGLTGVVIPHTVQTIGSNAFYDCQYLSSVTIPNGVSQIDASAFAKCPSLTRIVLPNSLITLGWNAFYDCPNLTDVTLSKSLSALNGTFKGCTSLSSVNIPPSVTVLDGTFEGCTSLTSVSLPRSLTYIGANTFKDCSSLTAIGLPNSVEYIGDMSFANTGLTSLELPNAVSKLGSDAFNGSNSLTSVTVRAANPPLMANQGGFSSDTYGLASLLVPEVSLASYQSTNWWNLFGRIVGQAALNVPYDFESGGIYYVITGAHTAAVSYKDMNYNSYSGSVTVPSSVTHDGVTYSVTAVGNSAFRGCSNLTSVNLPSSVTAIGKYAFFNDNSLGGIEFPEGLVSIGDSAFYSCTGLSALTIPVNVSTIGLRAFVNVAVTSLTWNARECWYNGGMPTNGITQLTIGDEVAVLPTSFARNSQITSLNLPASLTTIGDYAFEGCRKYSTLTIPTNVTHIGYDAFSGAQLSLLTWNARECWSIGNMNYVSYWYGSPAFKVDAVVIGDGVEVLPYQFVAFNDNITSLTIPNSVKHIASYAFCNCDGITEVNIPDAVQTIGDYAFCNCSNVSQLTVGKGVADLGEQAFQGLYRM